MERTIKENSFGFVRQLIEAERYKNFKKQYWGGADVIIASPRELDKKAENNITMREQLKDWKKGFCHLLVETEYASAVIWLIETLKSYINVDYLSKYEYYRSVGECVQHNESISSAKALLIKILDDPKVNHFEKKQNMKTARKFQNLTGKIGTIMA